MKQVLLIATFLINLLACQGQESAGGDEKIATPPKLVLGAEKFETYLPIISGRDVGLVVNHTSLVGDEHLVDTLLSLGVAIKKVFAPEHGFRGGQEAGETVENSIDSKTGIPIISLYGSNKKPSPDQLEGVDFVIFDIQDVGVRFYTYISTMHYVMEACAEQGKTLFVLDRPNPNGDYVDGPLLQEGQKSFVGLHPIPIVHGLTVGELAEMIQNEKWLKDSIQVDLQVVKMSNYHHQMKYELPVKPSPNLPNYQAIRLYPSLCLFEGSQISIGRGTQFPFQVFGHPEFSDSSFSFTPTSIPGMDQNPKHKDQACGGMDLRQITPPRFTLSYLITAYSWYHDKDAFFKKYFNRLAGNDKLMEQIAQGLDEKAIRSSWQHDLDTYISMREKYLLYPKSAP